MTLPTVTPGPVIGAGGYLGAMGHAVLESNFATAGAYILTFTVFLAGMLLCTDYLLLKFAAVTALVSGRSVMSLGHLGPPPALRRKPRPQPDLEDEFEQEEEGDEEWEEDEYEDEEYEEDEGGESASADDEQWEEDELEDDDEYEDEQADEEESEPVLKVKTPASKQEDEGKETAAVGLKSKLASALRIKRLAREPNATKSSISSKRPIRRR